MAEATTQVVGEQAATEKEAVIGGDKSIAVLPFDNRSNREEDEFFTEGIHDDLLTTIAKIGSIKVISRTSVMGYKDSTKKIPEIAKELGVAHILEGGIQRSGNQVRINVQLIDGITDEHLWAEIFDRELTAVNLFAIQSEISQKIADALQATLSPEEQQRINTMPTDNLVAYDAYLRGRQLMAPRQSAKLELAIEEFRKAVELDPKFALAWVGLADSYNLLTGYGTMLQEDVIPIREDAIGRALAIDDQIGEAYASLASVHEYYQRFEEAEAAYQKAIELSPNYATAYHWYSLFLENFPLRAQEAVDLIRKAAELDPRSPIIAANVGFRYQNKGLISLAEHQFQRVIELHPGFVEARRGLATFYAFNLGQYDKALASIQIAHELDPGNVDILQSQAQILWALGDLKAVNAIRTQMEELDSTHWRLGFVDMLISLAQENPAGTREAINWTVPRIKSFPYTIQFLGSVELALGDEDRARELFLTANPGWLEPSHWQGLINRYETAGCIFSWILMNTGDEELGADLLKQTTVFLEESLPDAIEHADRYTPDICFLVAGDTEKALRSIETQLAHQHYFYWGITHQLPMYNTIRHEPRYLAIMAERERRIALQREVVTRMDTMTGR